MIDRFELGVRGAEALATNFRNLDRKGKQAIRKVVRNSGRQLYQRAFRNTPVDTGYMREHLKLYTTALTYEVGWDATDFFGEGKPFYPEFVEFGTYRMAPRFPLTRAYEEEYPRFLQEIEKVIVDTIERGIF